MPSVNAYTSSSDRRPDINAGRVSTFANVLTSSGRASGILERKLTDMVTKELMTAHLSLDLQQAEKPEIARLYQEVTGRIVGELLI